MDPLASSISRILSAIPGPRYISLPIEVPRVYQPLVAPELERVDEIS